MSPTTPSTADPVQEAPEARVFTTQGVERSWAPSRFNMWARGADGYLLVYNSFTAAFVQLGPEVADHVAAVLAGAAEANGLGDLQDLLAGEGILVDAGADELERARLLHESLFDVTERLDLILMPTEQCNFRCVYCYEDFKRGRMPRDVVDGVVNLVEQEAPALRRLRVSWFGGEPLAALDTIDEISERIIAICDDHGVEFDATATTNAYLLNDRRADRCFRARIFYYQVTLDGPRETHDTLRKLAGGGPTFDRILANLLSLRERPEQFHVRLRVNFTPDVATRVPEFLSFLGTQFGGDRRFSIAFHPVGHWGGPNDNELEVCDERTAVRHEMDFMALAQQAGFGMDAWKELLSPVGSICYAADPRSFVIGSDGTVYKCTVAFKDPRNQVGRLSAGGDLVLDEDLLRLWTSSGEETDSGCQQCSFRPACQGNSCPLERLRRGHKVCPTFKHGFEVQLPILAADARARSSGA
jgi:uncharacterized protein